MFRWSQTETRLCDFKFWGQGLLGGGGTDNNLYPGPGSKGGPLSHLDISKGLLFSNPDGFSAHLGCWELFGLWFCLP